MAIDLTVPAWLNEKTAQWLDRLSMREWNVGIQIAVVLDDNPECRGFAIEQPDINFGLITLRADIEDTRDWEVTLVHELLHIKHSRIDNYIDEVVAPNLNGVSMGFAWQCYKKVMEPFIQSMAEVLVDMHRGEQS